MVVGCALLVACCFFDGRVLGCCLLFVVRRSLCVDCLFVCLSVCSLACLVVRLFVCLFVRCSLFVGCWLL